MLCSSCNEVRCSVSIVTRGQDVLYQLLQGEMFCIICINCNEMLRCSISIVTRRMFCINCNEMLRCSKSIVMR